jgi:lipid-A-disaccharide synthase
VVTELGDKHDLFAASDAALTKSGTSTLELALAGVPMAVTYRVNPISAAIARRLIRVPYVAMVNLLAGRALAPELLQKDCNPRALADTVLGLLRDPATAEAQQAGFRQVIEQLRPAAGAPSDAAAREVVALLPIPQAPS